MNTNYSFSTSLPAYQTCDKATQCVLVERLIKEGVDNLKQLSEKTGLDQSTISARVNNLIDDKRVIYSGHVTYKNRLRKRIVVFNQGAQTTLFG